MSKAEKYISEHTRNCSNVFVNPQLGGTEENCPWLTPDQARKAVEIAREEMIEKAVKWLKNNLEGVVGGSIYIEDFLKAIKDE